MSKQRNVSLVVLFAIIVYRAKLQSHFYINDIYIVPVYTVVVIILLRILFKEDVSPSNNFRNIIFILYTILSSILFFTRDWLDLQVNDLGNNLLVFTAFLPTIYQLVKYMYRKVTQK